MELVQIKPQVLEVTTKHTLPLRVALRSAAEVVADTNKHLLSAVPFNQVLFQRVEALIIEPSLVVDTSNTPRLIKLLKSMSLHSLPPRLPLSLLVFLS